SRCRQRLPTRTGEQRLVAGVRKLRVGDPCLAAQSIRYALVSELAQPLVDGYVDATDEDAGDAADLGEVPACLRQILKSCDIGFDHLLVDTHGEKQRDIDVQPPTGQLGSPVPSPSDWDALPPPTAAAPRPRCLRYRWPGRASIPG